MLSRTVYLASVVFWSGVLPLGAVLVLPWLRIGWLQASLAIPVAASAATLLLLSCSPGYVPQASRSVDIERSVYTLALFFAALTIAR
jgi:hypothetical protein